MNSQTVPRFWELYRQLPEKVQKTGTGGLSALRRESGSSQPALPSLGVPSGTLVRSCDAVVGLVEGNTITWFWIGDHRAFDREFPA